MKGERRELVLVCLAALALAAPFWGKPAHVDEPFFLAVARQIARSPLHPYAFSLHVYGRLRDFASVNNTPPLFPYLLAAARAAAGEAPAALRLILFPLDLLAAAALYGLAARFLKRPLWPTLAIIAAPAYAIDMNHLMPEKAVAAFGFAGLWALVRGLDEDDGRRYWGSAGLLGAALLSKYHAVFLLAPAAAWQLARRTPPRRVAAHLALSAAPLALYLLAERLLVGAAPGAAWRVLAETAALPTSSWSHRARALLAFVGGCGVVTAAWPWAAWRTRGPGLLLAAASAVLFVPALDLGPVRLVDRLTGALLAAGAARGLWGALVESRRDEGWPLLAPWAAAVLALQGLVYWSIMARFVLFALPPLVLLSAAALERALPESRLRALHAASVAATAALTLALSRVDLHYAAAQRDFGAKVLEDYRGRRVWCAAQGALQRHLEAAGVPPLDADPRAWDAVRPGDVVVRSRVGTPPGGPGRPLRADVGTLTVDEPVPLRLQSGWTGEGGFYASFTGFLPWSLSREPLEEFTIVEPR